MHTGTTNVSMRETRRPLLASLPSPGKALELDVEVRNPFAREETAVVELVTPWGNQSAELGLAARGTGVTAFTLRPGSSGRVAADLTVAGVRFGQQAEALVEVG